MAADSLERQDDQLTGVLAAAASAVIRQPSSANVERFRSVSRDTAVDAQWEIAWLVEDQDSLDVAERLVRPLTAAKSAQVRALSYWFLATARLARGHWQPAAVLLDSVDQQAGEDLPRGLGIAVPILLPFLPVPHAQLDSLRRAVPENWPPDRDTPEAVSTALRLYASGVLSARLGDGQTALQAAETIERLPVTPELGQQAPRLAAALRAAVAFERGGLRRHACLPGPCTGNGAAIALPYARQRRA